MSLALLSTLLAGPALAGPYARTKITYFGEGDEGTNTVFQGRVGYDKQFGAWTPYVELGGGIDTPADENSNGLWVAEIGTKLKLNDRVHTKLKFERFGVDNGTQWKIESNTTYRF